MGYFLWLMEKYKVFRILNTLGTKFKLYFHLVINFSLWKKRKMALVKKIKKDTRNLRLHIKVEATLILQIKIVGLIYKSILLQHQYQSVQ